MRRILHTALFAAALAFVLHGCGGSNPNSPTGKGVVLQGTVLGMSASGVAAQDGRSSTTGQTVVTVKEKPSITATVDASGKFELEDLPPGTVTLVFTRDGTTIGTVTLTNIPQDAEVQIVVQITPTGVTLVSSNVGGEGEGEDDKPGPTPSPSSSPRACLIHGGTVGSGIELEGSVASGNTSAFRMNLEGERGAGPVDVNAASASWKCVGKDDGKSVDCKASFKAGNQVHVKGVLNACTTTTALVNASEVMIQKDDD